MPEHPSRENSPVFATTRWSVVLAARDGSDGSARPALETLCRTYWPALYGYARRRGLSAHDAEDATQSFFALLVEKNYLAVVQREKGPFRAFLQMAFRRFLSKERDRAAALQRGGRALHLSLDFAGAECGYAAEAPHLPADEVFEQRWALTVLTTVMFALREEARANGREAEFEVLKKSLSTPRDDLRYVEIATALHVSEGAARVAAHRLRKRFREAIREEIAETVSGQEEVEAELRHLMQVFSG